MGCFYRRGHLETGLYCWIGPVSLLGRMGGLFNGQVLSVNPAAQREERLLFSLDRL